MSKTDYEEAADLNALSGLYAGLFVGGTDPTTAALEGGTATEASTAAQLPERSACSMAHRRSGVFSALTSSRRSGRMPLWASAGGYGACGGACDGRYGVCGGRYGVCGGGAQNNVYCYSQATGMSV